MVQPHSPTTSNSSALFGSDDSSFLEALGAAAQNEDTHRLSSSPSPILEPSSIEPPPCAQPTNAQPDISSDDEPEQPTTRTPTHAGLHPQHPPFVISDDDEPSLLQPESPPLAQSRYRKRAHSVSSNDEPARPPTNSPTGVSSSHLDSDTYGASRFGEFGEYMRRKRAKLQIQNAEMGGTPRGEASGSQLFKDLSIHVGALASVLLVEALKDVRSTGWTEPSVQELLLTAHSTHIITCSLTPAKVREFKHMKVVKPEWLVQSAKAGVLLPWQDFIFLPGGRPESAQGRLAQSSLTEFSTSKPQNPLSSDRNPSAPLHLLQAPSLHPSSPTAPVPKYAKHESNPAAQRAMADPAWRAAHTSAAPGFIAGYYANSRLHHLSMWKAELRTLVVEAQERAERGDLHTASRTSETGAGVSMRGAALRVIMHVDFDAFFVSAGLVSRPHLRGKPVVVCHSQHAQGGATSTSEIASASYEARKFGIKNGMSLQQARRLCPDLWTIPYEFERYRQLSLEFYTILMSHADDLQAVSVDEALIDVTSTVAQMRVVPTGVNDDGDNTSTDIAKELAESVRAQIKAATGCIASIGIAPNIMLARLATRHLLPDLDIQDLHGFGRAARDKASEKLGTTNLGELAGRSKAALCDALGNAMGETLYNSIRGMDDRELESDKPRKSVSCDINYGIRFENDVQVEAFIHQMSEEVAHRLNAINTKGRSLTLKIMKRDPSAPVEPPKFMGHGQCVTYNKQSALAGPDGRATSDPRVIGSLSWRLLRTLSHAHLPFRQAPNPTTAGIIAGPAPKARAPSSGPVTAQSEPKGPAVGADLPSFSQLDMSVFEALPEDIQYKRRSAPAPNKPEPPADPTPRANSAVPARGWGNDRPRGRGTGAPGELEELGIDAEVFSALPLAAARGARVRPSQQPVRPSSPLRPLQRLEGRWAPPQGPHERKRPVLRRGDADTSPVVDGAEVRRVVRAWVEQVRQARTACGGLSRWSEDTVVRCVATDVGAERAVGVMRWWGALLRRRWAGRDEEPEPGEDIRAEVVGMGWWRAYREVGDNLNAVVRKRFGGSLKFR
ncbi:DNA repair protein [Lactarius indigo]|nr:DNA repair protein [Lactarius indigo]